MLREEMSVLTIGILSEVVVSATRLPDIGYPVDTQEVRLASRERILETSCVPLQGRGESDNRYQLER